MPTSQVAAKLFSQAPKSKHAPGTITGINHMVLVTNDMEKTARFYCEVLGFRIVGTHGRGSKPANQIAPTGDYSRLYFFEMANGDTIGIVEFPDRDTTADASFFDPFWPKGGKKCTDPRKMDHLAFNVESYDDLIFMQKRLRDRGIDVSDVQELTTSPFMKSIYLYDPNGIPIEFVTWDWNDPAWKARTDKEMFVDLNPIPYLRELQGRK